MTQVFLDPDKRGNETLEDAEVIKAQLEAMEDFTVAGRDLGDSIMLQNDYPGRSEAELALLFGAEFARAASSTWVADFRCGAMGISAVSAHRRI